MSAKLYSFSTDGKQWTFLTSAHTRGQAPGGRARRLARPRDRTHNSSFLSVFFSVYPECPALTFVHLGKRQTPSL